MFNNLLQTAIKTSFLHFPFTANLLQNTLQPLLYLQVLKQYLNNKSHSFSFPILLIRFRLLTLDSLCLIIGVNPE